MSRQRYIAKRLWLSASAGQRCPFSHEVLQRKALVLETIGRWGEAESIFTSCLEGARAAGDKLTTAIAEYRLAKAAHKQGDNLRAIQLCRTLNEQKSLALYLGNLGNLEFEMGMTGMHSRH